MGDEAELEARCVKYAKACGYEHRKLDVGINAKGWLDHAFWGPRQDHFIVEFKIDDEALTPLQERRYTRLYEMGHEVYVVRDFDHFIYILEASEAARDQ